MEICEFMVIDKEDFNSLGLKQIFEKEYQERRSFFFQFPEFRDIFLQVRRFYFQDFLIGFEYFFNCI